MRHTLTNRNITNFIKHFKQKGNDCWEWIGELHKLNNTITPTTWLGGMKVPARRVSQLIFFGKTPRYTGTTCGNAKCINPAHISHKESPFETTKIYKTRSPKRGRHKLKVVNQILTLKKLGMSRKRIAKKMGLHYHEVCLIVRMGIYCTENRLRKIKRTKMNLKGE